MKLYQRVYAKVNLDAIQNNLLQMKKTLPAATKMVAVIKADGYGHGAVQIAQMLEDQEYIWGYGVATADEALTLRKHGMKKPILCLGVTFEAHMEVMIKEEVRFTVFEVSYAKALGEVAKKVGKNAYVHLKLDTGMGRLGICPEEEGAFETAKEICQTEGIFVEGIFSHFAKADELDKTATKAQMALYEGFVAKLEEAGVEIPIKHLANSAGIIEHQANTYDLARAGISTYGYYPSDEVNVEEIVLEPALSIHSCISYVKEVPEGTAIGYGGTYVTNKKTKIATVPVGYGDGYPRLLSNKADVLIRGKRAPIVGRICMDQFMVDVTDIKDVQQLDEVILMGNMGNETITAVELGNISGRFHYEFLCDIGKRIPRVYVKDNQVVETKDWFY